MKALLIILNITLILTISIFVFAQSPSPAVAVAAVPSSFNLLVFIKAHWMSVSAFLYYLMDLALAISPKFAAMGINHQILIWLGRESGQLPPQAS